jgi:hypothetical protein
MRARTKVAVVVSVVTAFTVGAAGAASATALVTTSGGAPEAAGAIHLRTVEHVGGGTWEHGTTGPDGVASTTPTTFTTRRSTAQAFATHMA